MGLASQSPGTRLRASSATSCAFTGRNLAVAAKIDVRGFFWDTYSEIERLGLKPTAAAIARIATTWGVSLTAHDGRRFLAEMQADIERDEAETAARRQSKAIEHASQIADDARILADGIDWYADPHSLRERNVRQALIQVELAESQGGEAFKALRLRNLFGFRIGQKLASDAQCAIDGVDSAIKGERELKRRKNLHQALQSASAFV